MKVLIFREQQFIYIFIYPVTVTCLRTDSSEQAHDQQDDDAPEHVHIHLALQFAALVARPVVVQHGFGLVTCEDTTQRVSSSRRSEVRGQIWSVTAGLTCVNDDPHGLLRVADGAASQQQVLFVKCVSSAAPVDSVR